MSRRSAASSGNVQGAFLESLEGRTLMSTYDFTVEVDAFKQGIAKNNNIGTGSLAATAVVINSGTAPALETVLRTALTQSSVTLTAMTSPNTHPGSYSGAGPDASNRLLFLTAEGTGKNYPGTTSKEASLATAFGLSGDYVLGYEDKTDNDYNDGYFLVTITDTTPPPGGAPMAMSLPSSTSLTHGLTDSSAPADKSVLA
jgi:hypothetical protein